jgi:hypothetical protein
MLRHIIEEGAVLYLNSQPIYSIRLPADPNCQTLATGTPGRPVFEPPRTLPPVTLSNTLVSGMNLIAAEVHEYLTNELEAAFAVSIETVMDAFVPGLSLSVPDVATNGTGFLANAGRVTLTEPATSNVVIVLTSSAPATLTVEPTVTVLPGATNAFFNIIVASNNSPVGARRVSIGASASGFIPIAKRILVLDSLPDVDGDSLPDDWEMEFFRSVDAPNAGAQQDFDGDGVSNLQEYLNGTDPTDPSNALRIKNVSLTGGIVGLRFQGVTGVRYQLERAPSVVGPWEAIGPILSGQGRTMSATDMPPAVPSLFYRVKQIL